MKPIRCLHWNILEGFRKPLESHADQADAILVMDEKRLHLAQNVIGRLKPDILILNEALWCNKYQGQYIDYKALFGFEFDFGHLYQKEWGNVILSRFPIVSTHVFSIHNRSGIIVNLKTPGDMCVATYHPHPSRRPHMKTEDLLGIVKMTQANGLVPTLLCGDMNCVNPLDLPSRQRLVNGFSNFSKTPEKDVLRFLEGGEAIFSALETVGFRDAMPKSGRHYSIPTDLLNSNKITAMRLDHMFANTLIQVVGGTVVEDQDAEWASDHRPLYLDIESIMLGNIATSELP